MARYSKGTIVVVDTTDSSQGFVVKVVAPATIYDIIEHDGVFSHYEAHVLIDGMVIHWPIVDKEIRLAYVP